MGICGDTDVDIEMQLQSFSHNTDYLHCLTLCHSFVMLLLFNLAQYLGVCPASFTSKETQPIHLKKKKKSFHLHSAIFSLSLLLQLSLNSLIITIHGKSELNMKHKNQENRHFVTKSQIIKNYMSGFIKETRRASWHETHIHEEPQRQPFEVISK